MCLCIYAFFFVSAILCIFFLCMCGQCFLCISSLRACVNIFPPVGSALRVYIFVFCVCVRSSVSFFSVCEAVFPL